MPPTTAAAVEEGGQHADVAVQKGNVARNSPAWALLASVGAACCALAIVVLMFGSPFDYRNQELVPAVVLLVLGLPAAVAGSLKSKTRPCLLALACLLGLAIGGFCGWFWGAAMYSK
jgi:hypothetical protein